MRLLFTDSDEGALGAIFVTECGYDVECRELWFASDYLTVTFYSVSPSIATITLSKIARDGFLDLSHMKGDVQYS